MRRLWVNTDMDASAADLWRLLTDVEAWPAWGLTVRDAGLDGDHLHLGSTGTVAVLTGLRLPFEITAFEDGRRWAWRVAGVVATDHRVEPLGVDRCRVGFGVPWPAAPYLAVCRVALRRLESMATRDRTPA